MSYKIKCKNEDFQVIEVPLAPRFTNRSRDHYTYLWIQKSGFTTFDCYDALKDFFKLTYHDINNQGLKDEDAITEQMISVKKRITPAQSVAFNKKYKFKNKFIKIKQILGTGEYPIKEKNLHGNTFYITVRNLDLKTAKALADYLSQNRAQAMVNYYDNQRFGMPGGPYTTHLIGKAIVDQDWLQALAYIQKTANKFDLSGQPGKPADIKNSFRLLNHKKLSFFISSYNSFLWNQSVSFTIKNNSKSKAYVFDNVGRLNLPIDHRHRIPHMVSAEGFEFLADKFKVKPKKSVRHAIVHTHVYHEEIAADELHRNKKKIALSFFLPTGSYATMLIKQIFLRLAKNK